MGIGLADDLHAIRTVRVKAELARNFKAAFDLVLFQMGRAVFAPGRRGQALDIEVNETPDRPMARMNDPDWLGPTMATMRVSVSARRTDISACRATWNQGGAYTQQCSHQLIQPDRRRVLERAIDGVVSGRGIEVAL